MPVLFEVLALCCVCKGKLDFLRLPCFRSQFPGTNLEFKELQSGSSLGVSVGVSVSESGVSVHNM